MRQSSSDILDRVGKFLAHIPGVRFAYVFGSYARNDMGPLSDIDIAVFLDRGLSVFDCRLSLMERLARELGEECIDLVTLNDAPVLLRYEVIREGRVIKEDRESRVPFEAQTLSEYLDTEHLRRTQKVYLKKQLMERGTGG